MKLQKLIIQTSSDLNINKKVITTLRDKLKQQLYTENPAFQQKSHTRGAKDTEVVIKFSDGFWETHTEREEGENLISAEEFLRRFDQSLPDLY